MNRRKIIRYEDEAMNPTAATYVRFTVAFVDPAGAVIGSSVVEVEASRADDPELA